MKFGMKHLGIEYIIIYSDGDPDLILTYFTARWKNVTMVDSLEIIADLIYCLSLPCSHVKNF